MADPVLILFDDRTAREWEPFSLTRPAGELVFGALVQRARLERFTGLSCAGHVTAAHLRGFTEAGSAPVIEPDDVSTDRTRLFLSSRVVPAWEAGAAFRDDLGGAGRAIRLAGQNVGFLVPAGQPAPSADQFLDPGEAATGEDPIDIPGEVIEEVWELALDTPSQLLLDIPAVAPDPAVSLGEGVYRIGSGAVHLGEGVVIEPGVVLDTTDGPIWLDDGAAVRAFTRLAGPAYVGPNSTILGGSVEAVSIGPVCKVRGEVAESVLLGFCNKAHDGHLGHAYLGRWVNLGAETTNSDLKNNYGSIRITTAAGERDTGRIKLGSLLGDHVKTGIGLLLNTGTVVGAGSNLFGAEMPPKWVPPFRWGSGDQLVPFRVDKFLEVAERVMERRGVALGDGAREQLEASWRRGCAQAGDEVEQR